MQRFMGGMVGAALVLGACSGGGEAVDRTDSPPSTVTTVPRTTPATTTTSTTTTSTTTPTTTTTNTTSTTSTTVGPSAAELACVALTAAPYPERRQVARELDDRDDRDEAAALCGDALLATEEALALEAARSAIDTSTPEGSSIVDLTCDFGVFNALITNPFDVPIGFYGVGLVRDANGDEVAHPDGAQVVWSIPPGERRLVFGALAADDAPECGIDGAIFLADDPSLPGDAGLPGADDVGTPYPPEPADWFPRLIDRELAGNRSGGRPELVVLYEDLRSVTFPDLDDPDVGTRPPLVDTDLTVRVCGVADRPDDDHATLVLEQSWTRWVERIDGVDTDSGPGSGLWLGAFRRGQDGLWRWLGAARRLPNAAIANCDAWSAARA